MLQRVRNDVRNIVSSVCGAVGCAWRSIVDAICRFIFFCQCTATIITFVVVGAMMRVCRCVLAVVRLVLWLPVTVLRLVGIIASKKGPSAPAKRKRVAVIGGGIAGTGAAWSLAKSGECDVTLYEQRPTLGGNAKTNEWRVPSGGTVRTGLSVLAWPERYFKHYEALLRELEVPVTSVQPKFAVSEDHVESVYAQGEENPRWERDMRRWDCCVAFIRRVNAICAAISSFAAAVIAFPMWCFGTLWYLYFSVVLFITRPVAPTRVTKRLVTIRNKYSPRRTARGRGEPSFYEVTMVNPMNLISARRLASWGFWVSTDFWNLVVVPVYSSSFLTAKLDNLPALILPALDDIISVGKVQPLRPLNTWCRHSKEVFDKMAATIGERNIVLNADLVAVEPKPDGNQWFPGTNGWRVRAKGGSDVREFDEVVFACPATAVDRLTAGSAMRDPLFDSIIPQVRYENERDDNFVTGEIHTNRQVLPKKMQPLFFTPGKQFTNYVRVVGDKTKGILENTFVLGTWVPAALQARESLQRFNDFFVTYNASPENLTLAQQRKVGEVDNTWAHPQFTLTNLALTFALPLLQGRRGAYYCAFYTTPGNGHDLSLLSGLVVASQITSGSYYPFAESADQATQRDFDLLTKLLGF